jgi:N-acetylglutamate synthase-like GNAT family acetyltransferase
VPEPRQAKQSDAAAIWELRNTAISSQCAGYYDQDILSRWTSGSMPENFEAIVAEHFHVIRIDGHLAATGAINLDSGKIDAVFVSPSHFRQGLGRKMLAHLEHLARQSGVQQIFLEATLNAADFYRSCGFEGKDVAVYRSRRGIELACVPMSKRLAE